MKIEYEKYTWKLVGFPKDSSSEVEEIEIFSGLIGPAIDNLMQQLALYNAENSLALKFPQKYAQIKLELHESILQIQKEDLIKFSALSNLTNVPIAKLEHFASDIDSVEFNSGELFMLSSTLNKMLIK